MTNPLFLLSSTIGHGALSGINLYLATFMMGFAIRFDFLQVHDRFQSFEVLANPWVMGVAGVMYLIELVADKIPGFDTVWDAIHTAVRPLGAIAVSLSSLGTVSLEWSVLAALLAGTASATTHTAKMGTRLMANASPEPFSNFALSLGEDAAVVTGMLLLLKYPYVAAGISMLTVVGLWVLIPRLFKKIGSVFGVVKSRLLRKFQPAA